MDETTKTRLRLRAMEQTQVVVNYEQRISDTILDQPYGIPRVHSRMVTIERSSPPKFPCAKPPERERARRHPTQLCPPLSRAGGERRLNVAITRARRQVVLFASFDPAELRSEQTTSVGIKHLRAYLDLAAAGVESISDDLPRERVIDQHLDEIANELRLRGYAVQTNIGLSDFRFDISIASADDPTQPVLAILLDGESWRSRRTVADRDGLPIEVLSKLMRWPGVARVWLPEWLRDRAATLERIEDATDEAENVLESQAAEHARPHGSAQSAANGHTGRA